MSVEGDAGHPLSFDAQLSTNYPDSSALLCSRLGSVSMERDARCLEYSALFVFIPFYPTSNTVQSLCTFAFYFGSAPASLR